MEVAIDSLVGEEGHLSNFTSLGIRSEEPPVKAVVIIEAEIKLFIFCVGLCVGYQELTTFRESQEHMARGQGRVRNS